MGDFRGLSPGLDREKLSVMFYGIWLAVLGALAVPSLVLRREEMKPVLDSLTPYQGWIGAVSALWGLWGVISAIL
ncbi:MAG: hypothetical protein AAFY60_17600, partial [Myxococcota bacterium]